MDQEGDLVSEAWVDYSAHSKGQFLDDLEKRLKVFMLRCVKVCRTLPKDYDAQHFGHQLIRSSSSAAANFRAVRRGRSQKEYFAKLSIVLEELDESLFWLETFVFTEIIPEHRLQELMDEGYQILKILAKSRKTASD
ncbi:four helix bundle protein [Spirosoma pollinicola]|uniref:Four helix bundle protein n=1 Tax=Spirosoma pollinicola TaxID=2057025 RepID=A0A2K8YW48_9BACT|nr:four helix bundle protein [Spirosoma pollinicola]AUD01846.1 four helix bundle protein [Spirosoma pollinicola]